MSGAASPVRKTRASRPADALGLAVLLVAALLAVGTALPLWGDRGPAFPRPSGMEGGRPPGAGGEAPASGGRAGRRAEAPSIPPTPHRRTALDINTAGVEALQALPGIGPVLARRIAAERLAHGPFRAPEDLLRVPGIGPKRWERIRDAIRVVAEGP